MKPDSILIIDDDRKTHEALDRELGSSMGTILHCESPEDGLRTATQRNPSLILLDINMPRMDGLKVCRHLKERESTRDIPVLFLTVDHNVQHIAKALECGGSDYIMKPFNPVELRARVRAALRTKEMIELLRQQARIDALTGVTNRAGLDEGLASSVSLFNRSGRPVSLLMLDIDHFKQVNDKFGHGVGDEVLRAVGETLRSCGRPSDAPCRFGGDEFAVILEGTDRAGARIAAARILESIQAIEVPSRTGTIHVRASGGLASSCDLPAGFDPEDLLKAADEALLQAKAQGRNRLAFAGEA